jgi:hypothetical protein
MQYSLTVSAKGVTTDDGQVGPKHVVKKEERKYTSKFPGLHCDGSIVIVCKITQQDA